MSQWHCLSVAIVVCMFSITSCKTARYEFVGTKDKSSAGGDNSGAEDGLNPKPGSGDSVAQLPPDAPGDDGNGVPLELPPTARVEVREDGKLVTTTQVNRKVIVMPSQDTMDGDNVSDPGNCPNPGIIEARYDFGNGETKTVKREPHDCKSLGVEFQWKREGLYEIRLVVVSDEKEEAQSTVSFSVVATPTGPSTPASSFKISVTPAMTSPGIPVTATGICSTPTANRITWDFGDSESASGAEVQHAYKTSGSYIVTGLCTDQSGLTLESSVTILVAKKIPPSTPGQKPGQSPGQTPGQSPGQTPGQN